MPERSETSRYDRPKRRYPPPGPVRGRAGEGIPADTARVVGLGATAVGPIVHDAAGSFQVLLDPEGNEWCLVG